MKRITCILIHGLLPAAAMAATITVGPWKPVFKGIDQAAGQQTAVSAGELNQQVLCLRVDLTDPDVSLLTTPKCTNCGSYEVLAENTSHFLEQYGLQAAVNGGNYASSSGPNDVAVGTPEDVYGLSICRGTVVSPNMTGYLAVMLFTTNNQAIFIPTNSPATNTAGIYTAIAGNRILVLKGVNVQASTPNDLDPRTAIGLSADRRYLYLQTIDGRQTGWSDGADFHDTGEWLKRFGAYDAINVDGGGSTTMSLANCVGGGVTQNRSSFYAAYGRERNIGHNFGVYASPLASPLENLTVEPGSTTAILTWQTEVPATTQVEYGSTTNYGNQTSLDSRLLRKHVATLAGLSQGSNYYFQALSTASGVTYSQACQFSTSVGSATTNSIFGLNQAWRYSTNNLDGVNWQARAYNDTNWTGQGPGLLYVESNTSVQPRNTALPSIYSTYYFRTHFNFSGTVAGTWLIFSNYVDDGAVFYLNGVEVYRLRMASAPTAIAYASKASGSPCYGTAYSGDAVTTCPDVFTLAGNVITTNLLQGDNVIAVEVHNYGTLTDVVFGSALIQISPVGTAPALNYVREDAASTLFWNGEGFTLQGSANLGSSTSWLNISSSPTPSPFVVTNPSTLFYRLKK